MGHFLRIQDNLQVHHFDYYHPSYAYPVEEVFHLVVILVALLMNSIVIINSSFLAHPKNIVFLLIQL